MKLFDEQGNAVIEFITIGLIFQVAIFGFMIKLGSEFRGEISAASIARHTLRSFQLSNDEVKSLELATQISKIFGISSSETKLSIQNQCSELGIVKVEVHVRGSSFTSTGFCID